ncbi:MAG: IncA protein [Podoviridae sp. ctviO18]|nr:MAG: IncA protein [Podoviridae sp. ctviO18]
MPKPDMNKPARNTKYPDQATEEIVKKMKEEGHDMSQFEKSQPDPIEPDDSDEDEENDEEEQPEKKDKKADKGKSKKPAKKSKSDEDSDEEDEDEEEQEDKDDDEGEEGDDDGKKKDQRQTPRRQVLIPVVKVKQREKQLKQELETKFSQQITDLTNQITTLKEQLEAGKGNKDKVDDKVEALTKVATEIAEKHGTDASMVEDILKAVKDLVSAGIKLPDELKDAVSTIKELKAKDEKRQAEDKEEKETEEILGQFDIEFSEGEDKDGNATGIENNPDIVKEVRASGLTLEEFKERLQDLVLGEDGERYAKLTLVEVYQLKKSELLPKKKKSADSQSGRSSSGESVSDDEDLSLPSPEEQEEMIKNGTFGEFSDKLGKRSKSKVHRRGSAM